MEKGRVQLFIETALFCMFECVAYLVSLNDGNVPQMLYDDNTLTYAESPDVAKEKTKSIDLSAVEHIEDEDYLSSQCPYGLFMKTAPVKDGGTGRVWHFRFKKAKHRNEWRDALRYRTQYNAHHSEIVFSKSELDTKENALRQLKGIETHSLSLSLSLTIECVKCVARWFCSKSNQRKQMN